jgi:hypothetical protein
MLTGWGVEYGLRMAEGLVRKFPEGNLKLLSRLFYEIIMHVGSFIGGESVWYSHY